MKSLCLWYSKWTEQMHTNYENVYSEIVLVKYLERNVKHIRKISIKGQKNRSNEENKKHF